MSIEHSDKIDLIGTTEEEKVILTISDHLEWDNSGVHTQLLEDKIEAYLHFIESGQIYEDYPNSENSDLTIFVALKYKPDEFGLDFLNRCREIILSFGIGFNWEVLKSN